MKISIILNKEFLIKLKLKNKFILLEKLNHFMTKIKIVKNHSKPSLFYKIKAPLYKKIILLQTKASLKANKKYHKINLKANSIKNPKILSQLLKNNHLKKINLTKKRVL
jgi:hypothetical protein